MSDDNQKDLSPKIDDNELLKELEKSLASGDSASLMKEIEENMKNMKSSLEETFKGLDDEVFEGKSADGHFVVKMTGTYSLKEIDFDKQALQGGVSEFKWRINEAWKSLMEKIQKATQQKTMDLLGDMNLPPELQAMAGQQPPKEDDAK